MIILDFATKVDRLQKISQDIYLKTITSLATEMTEADIAESVRTEFRKKGINYFWYDVPISVLIGEDRFLTMAEKDYRIKSPSADVKLQRGNTIHIDMDLMDAEGNWGDFSATSVFQPKSEIDYEKASFLTLIQKIQREGIKHLTSQTTASQVARWYINKFKEENITLLDVRNTVGHSIHSGSKKYPDGREKRMFLEEKNETPLGEGVYAIEPGGFRKSIVGNGFVVGRFEDCVYIPPSGKPLILGNYDFLPVVCK